jgi:hypothetical protein
LLPHVQSQVSLTRADFEDLIFPQLADTVQALERTLASAGLAPVDLDGVLVIGGSSRIPLVAQMLAAKLGRPVAVDPDAQTAVALGAALSALPAGTVQIDDATEVDVDPAIPVPAPVAKANSQNPEPAAQALSHEPPWLTAAARDLDSPDAHWRRASSERLARFAAAGLFALVLAGGAVSAPFIMTSYWEPSPAPAEILAPQSPAASVAPALPPPAFHPPAPQPPALAPPGFQPPAFPAPPLQPPAAPGPPVAVVPAPNPSSGAGSTTPAAPSKPPGSTTRSKGAAVPAPPHSAKAPKAPAPSPPPDAPQVPDWVNQARS